MFQDDTGPSTAGALLSVDEVVAAVADVMDRRRDAAPDVTADTPIATLELDSLDIAELFVVLEDIAGTNLDPDSAMSLERVGDLVSLRPL